MDKYRNNFHDRVKPKMEHETGEYKVEPFRVAQKALSTSQFAKIEREEFFTEAYGEILSDLFVAWLKSEPHATKEREFLYATAMSLGEVKSRMTKFETLGNNLKFIKQAQEGAKENNG
jgi:sulfatase maturation enzyme AslB (radical SAM superfamily)